MSWLCCGDRCSYVHMNCADPVAHPAGGGPAGGAPGGGLRSQTWIEGEVPRHGRRNNCSAQIEGKGRMRVLVGTPRAAVRRAVGRQARARSQAADPQGLLPRAAYRTYTRP